MDVETTAREIGFDHVAAIRADDVVTSRELTASCNPQACPKYGSCWTCPPGVGVFEDILNDITSRDAGVIVQTVREGVDHYEDWDLIEEAHVRHNAKLDQLADVMRTEFADDDRNTFLDEAVIQIVHQIGDAGFLFHVVQTENRNAAVLKCKFIRCISVNGNDDFVFR